MLIRVQHEVTIPDCQANPQFYEGVDRFADSPDMDTGYTHDCTPCGSTLQLSVSRLNTYHNLFLGSLASPEAI